MATDIKKLADELVKLTVLEVNELKNILKDEYGIEPAAAAAVAVAAPAAGGDAAAADEGKSEYDVVLKTLAPKRLPSLKPSKKLPVLASAKPKLSSMVLLLPSKKKSRKKTPKL